MAKITNAELWNAVRKSFPNFASHTSEATKETFTEAGFEKLKNWNADTLNDFFSLSMRVWLNIVNISHATDTLESQGFGEYFDMPWGGYVQRMATNSVKPISPKYRGLKDGDSVDPFTVRKPVVTERFWKQNFDYASLVTFPDEFQMKQIFVSEYGMSEFMAGIMAGLENGYTIQRYTNKLEAINAGINSTDNPLQDTQHIQVALSAEPTAEELTKFLLAVKNVVSAMTIAPQTDGFNAMKYASSQDKSRLKLLIRPTISNAITVNVLAGIFNPEKLNLGVDFVEVPNFGGLTPYKETDYTTRLYEVYDKLGAVIGYAETQGASAVTVQSSAVFWKDPNEGVNAILADKGLIFECKQNPYTVEPIRNPAGRYTNYWASSPNNCIAYDPLYNVVLFEN